MRAKSETNKGGWLKIRCGDEWVYITILLMAEMTVVVIAEWFTGVEWTRAELYKLCFVFSLLSLTHALIFISKRNRTRQYVEDRKRGRSGLAPSSFRPATFTQ